MFNIFKKPSKLRTDGYYIGNKRGVNPEFNLAYNLYYSIIFNEHGIATFVESENEPYKVVMDEYREFQGYDDFDKMDADNFSKFQLESDNISMRFYHFDYIEDKEQGNINEEKYREWSGKVFDNGLLLSFYKAGFNYALKDYSRECYFSNLVFKFYKI